MPQSTGTVKIEIEVDDKGTVKVKKFGGETEKVFDRTGKSVGDFDKKLAGTNTSLAKMSSLVGTLVGAYGLMKLASALNDCVKAASDLEEVTSKFNVVFAEQQKKAEEWAQILVDSYAMSTREAKQYLASVQDLLVPMGMQADAAAHLSNEIVKLSADLGSFNNLPTAQVMGDIQSALVGNYETMKKYGVVVNATIVQEKALAMGLAASKDELTVAQKAFVAYKLIVEGSAAAIGDMARTQSNYANQVKYLKSNIENLRAEIGQNLLPHLSAWLDGMNRILKTSNKLFAPTTGDSKLLAKNYLEKQLQLHLRSYNLMVQQGNVNEEALRLAEARILTLKQRIQILQEEIAMRQPKAGGTAGIAAPDLSALTGGATRKGFQMGQDMWSMWAGTEEWGVKDKIYENELATKLDITAEHFRQMKELTAGNQMEIYEIYRQSALQLEAIEAEKRNMMIWSAETIASRVASAGQLLMSSSNRQNKGLFAITKMAAISEATINTYKAVMQARASAPPPMNYALAAAELAFGLAQVAKIKSQNYGEMAGGGGAVGTYAASSATGIPTRETTGAEIPEIRIVLKGESGNSDAFMDYLLNKINENIEVRGGRLVATEIA